MKPIRYPILSTIVAITLFLSCQRQLENNIPITSSQKLVTAPPVSSDPDLIVTAGVEGRVLDEHGDVVSDALVSIGEYRTMTNQFGLFKIPNIQISEQWSFVKVEKQGYFSGSRTFLSRPGTNSFIQIKLLPKELRGNFNAGQAASIQVGSAITINFQAQSIVDKNGNTYSGKVLVYGAAIDPLAKELDMIMPGDLRGIDSDNKVVAMRSFGMVGVMLETESGLPLQLAQGKPAQLIGRIAESMNASAPQQIPLWHFDETSGKWKQEGIAVKKDGFYSGSAPHFSFWNFDVPEDFVYVSMQLRGAKGSPVSYTAVKVVDMQNGSYSSVFTDSTGYLRAWVPKSVPVEIQVLNGCGEIILARKAGPFVTDTEIGTFVIQPDRVTAVSGKAVNCEGKAIAMGTASLYNTGLYYSADIVDGEFTVLVNNCSGDASSARLYITDGTTHRKSNWINLHIDGQETNAGQLQACQIEASEFAYAR